MGREAGGYRFEYFQVSSLGSPACFHIQATGFPFEGTGKFGPLFEVEGYPLESTGTGKMGRMTKTTFRHSPPTTHHMLSDLQPQVSRIRHFRIIGAMR